MSGSVNPVVITAPIRASSLPKTPSSAEAGLPDQTLWPVSWRNGGQSRSASLSSSRNRAGAAGNIAAQTVIDSQPDGYRLLVVMTVSATLYP